MLAFDIETMGLDASKHPVTIVCTEDFASGAKKSYEFARVRVQEPHAHTQLLMEMVQDFEEASSLCSFNGIRFDIPFLQTAFRIDNATVTRWILKSTDILECCRLIHNNTFSLNLLCEKNNMPVKISSGLQAVKMAADGQWEDLEEYCQDDVAILCKLYRKRNILNPRTGMLMDLSPWAHTDVYAT
tara:strand:- start:72 stop:629 length:558 start_codon:yes stop_codon:yes gene_type:complete